MLTSFETTKNQKNAEDNEKKKDDGSPITASTNMMHDEQIDPFAWTRNLYT